MPQHAKCFDTVHKFFLYFLIVLLLTTGSIQSRKNSLLTCCRKSLTHPFLFKRRISLSTVKPSNSSPCSTHLLATQLPLAANTTHLLPATSCGECNSDKRSVLSSSSLQSPQSISLRQSMPASHDTPPPPKRRRHDSSSPPYVSHPSYNRSPLPRSVAPGQPNDAASHRFRSPIPAPSNTYRPTPSLGARRTPPQKGPYQHHPPPSQQSSHSEWQNSQQNHLNMTANSNPNRSVATSSPALPPAVPPYPRVGLPGLANLSLSLPPPTVPPFAPPMPGFSPQYLSMDPLYPIPQSSSAQMQFQSNVNHQNVVGQDNGVQASAILPPAAPLVSSSPQSRSDLPRRDAVRQTQQSHLSGGTNTNGTIRSSTQETPGPSLASITPVADALALLPDDSPIISALARVLSPPSDGRAQSQSDRQRILNFKGFPYNSNPNFHALLVLSKIDLDILAWIFVVTKNGRKDEVARRILGSLRLPLRYRDPHRNRRPASLRNATTQESIPTPATPQQAGTYGVQSGQVNRTALSRSNMPSLAPTPNSTNLRGDSLLQHLERQLNPASNARQPSVLSQSFQNGVRPRLSTADIRGRQAQDSVHDLVQGYSFMDGENPFNEPMNSPLGNSQNFRIFSSVQLSRGNGDPVLMFPTPPPIDPKKRPEVAGGDVQIHLRCLKIEPKRPKPEWKQSWPFPASCRVNGHMVTLNQAQRYTNGKLAGIDTATNITPYLRKYKPSMSENNRVTLRRQASTASPASGQFIVLAQEVLVYSQETMTKNVHSGSERYWADHRRALEEKGAISLSTSRFEMARQGVVQFLTDPDGLTVSSMKVSLRCPLALTRITTPVKGKRCHHVQCFDLENFLEYSRRSSKFECPVCNKNTAYPSMLVVSPYIENALEKYKECDEVEIFQDGSMVPVERKLTGIASDDEDEEAPNSRAVEGSGNTHGGSKPAEVVDLTLDSEDDELADTQIPNIAGDLVIANSAALNVPVATDQQLFSSVQEHHGEQEMTVQSNEQGAASDGAGLDQEIDFTFRSDFVPWEDTGPVGEDVGSEAIPMQTQAQTESNRDQKTSWPIDVIAIDSD